MFRMDNQLQHNFFKWNTSVRPIQLIWLGISSSPHGWGVWLLVLPGWECGSWGCLGRVGCVVWFVELAAVHLVLNLVSPKFANPPAIAVAF